jgi:2-succinyl-6-hydroxy-2,4-cyclohexadiene-1-carboxylate synthase
MHGFLGSSRDWLKIISDLSSDYYCLAVDLPGHGKSVIPSVKLPRYCEERSDEAISINYSELNLHNAAFGLNAFLKQFDLISPVLIGYSMGGRIALHMLKLDEIYWHGAVLESTSPGIENLADRAIRLKQDFALATRLEEDDFNQFLEEWYQQPLFSGFVKVPDFKQILIHRQKNNPGQIAAALKAFSTGTQKSFWHKLKKFEIPIMLISGSNDEKYCNITKRISASSPIIKTRIIQGSGHVVHAEKLQKFSMILSKFLKTLSI